MKKTFFHKGIACLMAFTLFLTPGIPALAEESQTTEPIEPTEEATTPQEEMSLSDMAKSKASVLTSMYKVDSIQYALIDNDSIVLSGEAGYADKASKRMPYQSTIYGVGSISKVFTTVAVMQLVEQGKVNLDYPVTTYIDDFKMADARYRDITVRMLLNHSSGLLGSTLINSQFYGDNDHSTYDNFLELLSTQRLKADPGAFSVYCNDGFTLAELLVERVSGKTFTEYLEEYISKPMSLHDTKTPMDNINDSQMAGIYNPGSLSALPYETLMMIGAGGIYSTAADLCRFSRAFFTDNNTLLTNSSKKAMGEKEYLKGRWMDDKDSYSGYGLGWDTVNTYPFSENNMKVLAKGGDLSYYHGSLLVAPDQNMAVAVLSSGGNSSYDQILAQEILRKAMEDKGLLPKQPAQKPADPIQKAPMPLNLMDYAGIYANFISALQISFKDDTVILSLPEAPETTQVLTYTASDWFASEDGKSFIKFKKENNGEIYLMTKGSSSIPGVGEFYNSAYEGQKIKEQTLSTDVNETWKARDGKRFFIINCKYSSIQYAVSLSPATMMTPVNGFIGNLKVMDSDHLITDLQIPMQYGRDLKDIKMYQDNGVEYMTLGNHIGIEEDAIQALSSKEKSTVTLNNTGYAKYFKISKKTAGKKVVVTPPENSTFSVTDKNGLIISNYYTDQKKTIKLPKEGFLVFAGEAGANFTVQIK